MATTFHALSSRKIDVNEYRHPRVPVFICGFFIIFTVIFHAGRFQVANAFGPSRPCQVNVTSQWCVRDEGMRRLGGADLLVAGERSLAL
jgi:hypothetical protein